VKEGEGGSRALPCAICPAQLDVLHARHRILPRPISPRPPPCARHCSSLARSLRSRPEKWCIDHRVIHPRSYAVSDAGRACSVPWSASGNRTGWTLARASRAHGAALLDHPLPPLLCALDPIGTVARFWKQVPKMPVAHELTSVSVTEPLGSGRPRSLGWVKKNVKLTDWFALVSTTLVPALASAAPGLTSSQLSETDPGPPFPAVLGGFVEESVEQVWQSTTEPSQ